MWLNFKLESETGITKTRLTDLVASLTRRVKVMQYDVFHSDFILKYRIV